MNKLRFTNLLLPFGEPGPRPGEILFCLRGVPLLGDRGGGLRVGVMALRGERRGE